jgi:uncharacterized protein YeeX (DUF496 family)
MTLNDILEHLDALSQAELLELRQQIDQRTAQSELRAGTMDVDALLNAAKQITEDMSDEEIKEMVAAMNEEYIEPADDDLWRD